MQRILRAGLKDIPHFRIPKGYSDRTLERAYDVANRRDGFLGLVLETTLAAFANYKIESVNEQSPTGGFRLPAYRGKDFSKDRSAYRYSRIVELYRIQEKSRGQVTLDVRFDPYRPGKVPSFFLDITLDGEEDLCGRESPLPETIIHHIIVPLYEDILIDQNGKEVLEQHPPRTHAELGGRSAKPLAL